MIRLSALSRGVQVRGNASDGCGASHTPSSYKPIPPVVNCLVASSAKNPKFWPLETMHPQGDKVESGSIDFRLRN